MKPGETKPSFFLPPLDLLWVSEMSGDFPICVNETEGVGICVCFKGGGQRSATLIFLELIYKSQAPYIRL